MKGPTLHRYISAQNNLRYLGPEQEYEQSMLDLGAQLVQVSGSAVSDFDFDDDAAGKQLSC